MWHEVPSMKSPLYYIPGTKLSDRFYGFINGKDCGLLMNFSIIFPNKA